MSRCTARLPELGFRRLTVRARIFRRYGRPYACNPQRRMLHREIVVGRDHSSLRRWRDGASCGRRPPTRSRSRLSPRRLIFPRFCIEVRLRDDAVIEQSVDNGQAKTLSGGLWGRRAGSRCRHRLGGAFRGATQRPITDVSPFVQIWCHKRRTPFAHSHHGRGSSLTASDPFGEPPR